jgi:hypothetical protein
VSVARRLIVNADDFGLTAGVSRGILDAHRRGIVTSTTLLVNRPLTPALIALPSARARAVAATPVGTQQQRARLGVVSPTEPAPPASHTLHRELRGIVAHADVDEAFVAPQVIGPIGDGRASPRWG